MINYNLITSLLLIFLFESTQSEIISALCAVNVLMQRNVFESHNLIVLSLDPLAMQSLGKITIQFILPVCPFFLNLKTKHYY